MDPSLDHPGGIDAWLSTHCKIQPELLPLPDSDQLLHHLNAPEEGDFDLLELLSDDFHVGPGAQQANVSLQPGAQTLPNGLIDCLPGSFPDLADCNGTTFAAAQTDCTDTEHKHAASTVISQPGASECGCAVQNQQQPFDSQLYHTQQRQVQQLSLHSQQQQATESGPLPADQQTSANQQILREAQSQYANLNDSAVYSRLSLDTGAQSTVPAQQGWGSQLSLEGAPPCWMETSGIGSFTTYNNAAELAAAVEAQINAAADQHAVAAQVSLTNAVNAAAAQLRSGGPSAATAQLQQQLQRQQSRSELQLGTGPSCSSSLATPACQNMLQLTQPSSVQAGTPASLSLSLPDPSAAFLSPAVTAAVGTPHQYPLSSSSAYTSAGVPTAPFLGGSAAAASNLPNAAATLPAVNACMSSAGGLPAAAAGPGVLSAAGEGVAGFPGAMLPPAGASTGVPVSSTLIAWVQGLKKASAHQHEAHERRFKHRRKDKVSALQTELAAKQAQLQALSLEHMALEAKARALDQLVASAGDDVSLMEEQLAKLDLKSDSNKESEEAKAAAAAAVAALQGETAWPAAQQPQAMQQQQVPMLWQQQQSMMRQQRSGQQQQQQTVNRPVQHYRQFNQQGLRHLMVTELESLEDILSGIGGATSSAPAVSTGPAAMSSANRPAEQQQALTAGGVFGLGSQQQDNPPCAYSVAATARTSLNECSSGSGSGLTSSTAGGTTAATSSCTSAPGVESGLLGTAAAAAAARPIAAGGQAGLLVAAPVDAGTDLAGSLAYPGPLLLPRPAHIEEKLPEIQALHKRVVAQLMPLLLQIQQEQLQQQFARESQQDQQLPPMPTLVETPAMQKLTEIMLDYSRELHTFAIGNRVTTQQLYTLNIETGVLGQPPPEGHWKKVAVLLRDRLTPQQLADLCVARQLYSSTVMKIKQQRQLLLLQFQQLLDKYSGMEHYGTDKVHTAVAGPHCEGIVILDAIDTNMRKEYTLEGVYQWMTHHIIPMHVLAEMVVHSYPYKACIHSTLQELIRDQPMPALTAVQQLQLQQLQEQQAQLVSQQQTAVMLAQQQQAAALASQQQQQTAQSLQLLQQQQQLLCAAAAGNPGSYMQ